MAEDVKKLIDQARDFSVLFGVRKRRNAVQKLGDIGTPEVVQVLINALEDEDTDVKRFAFQGLTNLRDLKSHKKLREEYLKTKNKALWQIIKSKQMFPENLEERIAFFSNIKVYDNIIDSVNEENFMEFLDLVLNNEEIEKPVDLIMAILDRGIQVSEFDIIKKFVDSRNDVLFTIIDRKNWYPPELTKKIMFLLMTERGEKIHELLDGEDFREILDILSNPKFSMRKQALECIAQVQNQIIIDEICNIYLKDRNPHIGKMILDNGWSPQKARDRVLFFLKTDFLDGFFITQKVDPLLIGGYLEIVHIRETFKEEDYMPLANYFSIVLTSLGKGENFQAERDNPLADMRRKVQEYLECNKLQLIIDEIIYDFLQNRSPLLEYIIIKEGWAPESDEEKVEFFFRTNQEKKIVLLGDRAIKPLFSLIKGVQGKEDLAERAEALFKGFRSPLIIQHIFNLYFKTLDPKLEEIIKEKDWQPTEKTEKILFFILSGQLSRYREIEPTGHSILMETYKKLDISSRIKVMDILLEHQTQHFDNFILDLFENERNPLIFKQISNAIRYAFTRLKKPVAKKVRTMDEGVLRELIKTLITIKTDESSRMLFDIAICRKGYICLWILKILEEARWNPPTPHDRAFFYELYKIRDELLRITQNRLVDADSEIRAASAITLGKMSDERYLHSLMKYVEDPVDEVRVALAHSIGALCAISPKSALEQIESFRIGSIYMIFNDVRKAFMVDSEQQQVQIIARNYDIGNSVLRTFAIATLEGLKRSESVPALLKALADHEPMVKKSALRALRDVADQSCIPSLLTCIEDKDPENRTLAAEALANVIDEDTIEKLEKRLSSGDFNYSDGIITTFGRYNPDRFKELFRRIIQRPDFDMDGKSSAVIALGRIKDDEEIADFLLNTWRNLRLATDTQDGWSAYITAFKTLGDMNAYTAIDEMWKVGNWEIRRQVIAAMGNFPERIAFVTIIKAFEDPNGWVQLAALEAFNHYYNHHFVFKETEKDLKFIAAIIGRLKKFNLQEISDKMFPVYQVETQLMVLLLKNQLTKLYLEAKEQMTPEGRAKARAAAEAEKAKEKKAESGKGDDLWDKLKLGKGAEKLTGAQLMEKIKAAQQKTKSADSSEKAAVDEKKKGGMFQLRKITTNRPAQTASTPTPEVEAQPKEPKPAEPRPTKTPVDILKNKMKDGFLKTRISEGTKERRFEPVTVDEAKREAKIDETLVHSTEKQAQKPVSSEKVLEAQDKIVQDKDEKKSLLSKQIKASSLANRLRKK